MHAKMLKETKTEETTVSLCDIFIVGSISIGWGPDPLGPPLATPMVPVLKKKDHQKLSARSLACSTRRKTNGRDLGPFLTNQKIVLSRTGYFCRVLEPRTGHFRGLAGFEA